MSYEYYPSHDDDNRRARRSPGHSGTPVNEPSLVARQGGIRAAVGCGLTLRQARAQAAYHQLQTG